MFEARLTQGAVLKKIIDAIKDFVTEANFDCNSTSISLQAMDSSHVSLVSMALRSEGFEHYRCDRSISLGINIASLAKVLKCAANEDVITLKASDQGDSITLMLEGPDRVSDFELKLMDIDGEHLGIPEQDYKCNITLPSAEFKRICADLSAFGETVTISASKEGIAFNVSGDIGTGNIILRQGAGAVDVKREGSSDGVKIEMSDEVSLTFALRYLNYFTKASTLSSQVTLRLTDESPLMVEYLIDDLGHLRFYLAPKIDNEE
jgi:proliferating cell nuclear antigen